MATIEHCLSCFEALSAHLEKRDAMTLAEIQSSWATYPKALQVQAAEDDESVSQPASDDDGVEEVEEEEEEEEEEDEALKTSDSSRPHPKQTPSASKLLTIPPSSANNTPSSSSTTSLLTSTSTPASSITSSTRPSLSSSSSSTTTKKKPPPSPEITESPLFVTWNKKLSKTSTEYSLRGCIGTFEPQDLSSGLPSYALTSALHDTRFSPISRSELSSLQVAVTLLTDFEPCADPRDWDIGTHGIKISFSGKSNGGGGRYGATYLPDVCVEQGWTKEECLASLVRKAGWSGRLRGWEKEVGNLRVVRYKGKAVHLGFEAFGEWREWVREGAGGA